MTQAAGLRQRHETAQKTVVLQKGGEDFLSAGGQEGQQQTEVHGDAAQLKGKVPPVVHAGMNYQSEKELLVDFADGKKKAAQEKMPLGILSAAAEKNRKTDGTSDAGGAEKNMEKGIGPRRRHGPRGYFQQFGYHKRDSFNTKRSRPHGGSVSVCFMRCIQYNPGVGEMQMFPFYAQQNTTTASGFVRAGTLLVDEE